MTDTALNRGSSQDTSIFSDTPRESQDHGSDLQLDIAPIDEGGDTLLNALDIEGSLDEMPEADLENHKEVKQYILDIIKKSGDSPTMGAFKRTLNDIKADMGLSEDADPSTILDRIGGVVKSWKELSFIKSPSEKRSILSKLMRAGDSKEMNRLVYQEMTRRQVWQ